MHYFSEFIGVPIFIQLRSPYEIIIETTYLPQFVKLSTEQGYVFYTPYMEFILNYMVDILANYYPQPGRLEPVLYGIIGRTKKDASLKFDLLNNSYSKGFELYHNTKFTFMGEGNIGRLTRTAHPIYTIPSQGLYNYLLSNIDIGDHFSSGYGYTYCPIIHAVSLHLKVSFFRDYLFVRTPSPVFNPIYYPPFNLSPHIDMF